MHANPTHKNIVCVVCIYKTCYNSLNLTETALMTIEPSLYVLHYIHVYDTH